MILPVPAIVDALPVDESLGEPKESLVADSNLFSLEAAFASFPAIPDPVALDPSSLPLTNNPIESGALLEECFPYIDKHVQQTRSALASQFQSRLEAPLAGLKSEKLRETMMQQFGKIPVEE